MDNTITFGIAIIFLLFAMIYVTIKNRGKNQENNKEFEAYNKQIERLDEQLKRKEISQNTYELLRKNLEEQYLIANIQMKRN